MMTGLNAGTAPERMTARILNADTVPLVYGQPAYQNFVSGTVGQQDGVNAQRPSVAIAAGLGIYIGLIAEGAGVPANSYGDVQVYGYMINVPVICNSRANVGTAYGAQAAITSGLGLTIDTTNNYLTGLTTITKSQSNTAPAILIDTIPANQGQGTTPATSTVLLYKCRIFIPWF